MSTVKNITVRKGFPMTFKVETEDYFDKIVQHTFKDDNEVLNVQELVVWPKPEITYSEGIESPSVLNTDEGFFKDHEIRPSISGCLMPYGERYKGLNLSILNGNLINSNNVKIDENGAASEFSTINYLCLKEPFSPKGGDLWEVRMKFTTGSNLGGDRIFHSCIYTNGVRYGIGLALYEKINFFCANSSSGWLFDSYSELALEKNKTYWIKFGFSGDLYYLDYSLDGQDYTRTFTYESTSPVFPSLNKTFFGIYYNGSYSYPMSGSIDLNETKLFINNEVFWEYPQYVRMPVDHYGCLYNYTDNGLEHTTTAWAVKDLSTLDYHLVLSDTRPVIDNTKVYKLKEYTIPTHDLYNYQLVPGRIPFDVTLVGTAATFDEETGIFTGSPGTESYLSINHTFMTGQKFEMLLKFTLDTKDTSSVIGTNPNSYRIGTEGGMLGGYIGSSIKSSVPAEAGKTYWMKVVDSEEFHIYAIEDNGYTEESLPELPEIYTSSRKDLSSKQWCFGANIKYPNENMHGKIYVNECYLKVNDEVIFGKTLIPSWTKK